MSDTIDFEIVADEEAWGFNLNAYGTCQTVYEGKGTLALSSGEQVECDFQVGQLSNGDVILLCGTRAYYSLLGFGDSVESFHGVTHEGYKLASAGRIRSTNYLPNMTRPGTFEALHLERLSVLISEGSSVVRSVRFGITNFKFVTTQVGKDENNRFVSWLPLILNDGKSVINFCMRPVPDYDKLIRRLQTLKTIEVTCEAVAYVSGEDAIPALEQAAEALCRILSVARGTKIQWVYRDQYDEQGILLKRTHYEHITKSFCPMAIIDARYEGRVETRDFIEGAYPVFLERRDPYKLDKGTIDAYLDAKSEDDYLETRAVKLAVALEKLKAVFLSQPESSSKEFVIDESLFDSIKPKMKSAIGEVLNAEGVGAAERGEIYPKLSGLNRRSFADLLKGFLQYIKLDVNPKDLQLFIQCRNKLVHTGEFYCVAASPVERKKCTPLPTPAEEYYFMVNFLDRIFLRLLAYSGNYVDYRTIMTGLDKAKLCVASRNQSYSISATATRGGDR